MWYLCQISSTLACPNLSTSGPVYQFGLVNLDKRNWAFTALFEMWEKEGVIDELKTISHANKK